MAQILTEIIPLTVANGSSTTAMPVGMAVSAVINHLSYVGLALTDSTGYGLRVQYSLDTVTWADIPRAPDLDQGFNTATTKVWFPLQAIIAASGSDTTHYRIALYLGATAPAYDSTTRYAYGDAKARALMMCRGLILKNGTTITGGGSSGMTYYIAADGYSGAFAADHGLAMTSAPELFTPAVMNAFVSAMAVTDGSNHLPVFMTYNSSALNYKGGQIGTPYIDDAVWMLPLICEQAYLQDGTHSLTTFNAVKATLKTALQAIPLDQNLYYANPADSPYTRLSFGFYDGYLRTGHNTMGTVFFIRACECMARMYTLASDSANAATFTALAAASKTALTAQFTAGAPLYDSSGMLIISDHNIDGHQTIIDIFGTCHAAAMGYLTAPQAAAVKTWLHNNLNTIINAQGYCRQSTYPATPATYDDGYWIHGMQWVLSALSTTDANIVINKLNQFNETHIEWIGATLDESNVGTTCGHFNNFCNPFGLYAFLRDNPAVFSNLSSTLTGSDYSGVFARWDDMQTANDYFPYALATHPSPWVKNSTNWEMPEVDLAPLNSLNFYLPSVTANSITFQCDVKVVARNSADFATAILAASSSTTYATVFDVGYAAAIRGNVASSTNTLKVGVAWGTPFTFAWTTATWYRMKLWFVGTAIQMKIWVPGTGEPGSWSTALTGCSSPTSWFRIGGTQSNLQFKNLIVNSALDTDPTQTLATPQGQLDLTNCTPGNIMNGVAIAGVAGKFTGKTHDVAPDGTPYAGILS